MNPSDPVLAEAARWDARLRSGACSDSERDAFDAWRQEPGHAARYAMLQAALAELRHDQAERPMPVTGLSPRMRIGLAASFVFALALGGWALVRTPADLLFSAPAASPRAIRLADGSALLLAPGSSVRVRYAGEGRQATLLSGSAHLAVARDQRPFTLYVADRRVTTSGSELDVGLLPGHVRIGLLRGGARVHCWHGLLPSAMTLRVGQRIDAEIGSDRARVEKIT